jgi:hypothetical protein
MGWPQTKKMSSTFKPKWDDDEVHFKVRMHDKDGVLIDLTGAMLHVAVFDGRGNTEANLIGTFTLNLAYLIARSKQRSSIARRSPQASTHTHLTTSIRALFGTRRRARDSNSEFAKHNQSRGSEISSSPSLSGSIAMAAREAHADAKLNTFVTLLAAKMRRGAKSEEEKMQQVDGNDKTSSKKNHLV